MIGRVVLVATLVAAGVNADCTNAQKTTLNNCFVNYAANIGAINYYNRLPSYSIFEGFEYLPINSWPGVQTMCQKFNAMRGCLMNGNGVRCMSPSDFQSATFVSSNDATDYVIDYFQMEYMCNDGFNVYKNNYNCLGRIGDYSDKCNLYSANTCSSMNKALDCAKKEVKKKCSNDAANFVYHQEKTVAEFELPSCKFSGAAERSVVTGLFLTLLLTAIKACGFI